MVEWQGNQFFDAVRNDLAKKLDKACIHLKAAVKRKISRKQPRKRYSGRGISYKGLDPSKAGEAPKQLTSQLIRSIAHQVNKQDLSGRVGSGMDHAFWLEMGTSQMAARPFLRPALNEEANKIMDILAS